MGRTPMTQTQHSAGPAQWHVARRQALSLSIGPGPRELHLTHGQLWLTRAGTAQAPAEDLWLQAGDTLALASGSRWVVEGWGGEARFQLLVPPCTGTARWRGLARWLSRVRPSWGVGAAGPAMG